MIYLLLQITSTYAQEYYQPLLFAEQMQYYKNQLQNKVEQLASQEQEIKLNQNDTNEINPEINNDLSSAQSYKNLLENGVAQGRQLRNFYEPNDITISNQKSVPLMILPIEEYYN